MTTQQPAAPIVDRAVAERLLASRAEGDYFPSWMAGTIDLDQALQLQVAVLDDEVSRGLRLGGWKVGLTSEASRQKLGADERPFGFVRSERVLESGTSVSSNDVAGLSIETEMCFTIGSDINDASITPDRVLDHVASVSAGFELNEARTGTAEPDFFSMVTDCLTNWGIVHGAPSTVTDAATLSATEITMSRNGEDVFRGTSSDFVDDHTISLCRLVGQLARHGFMLRAGQRVITGAFARMPTSPGDHWIGEFSGIGTVEAHII